MSRTVSLGIDVGTQSVRVVAVAGDGTVLGAGSAPLTSYRDGNRHEQQPEEWWRAVCLAGRMATGNLVDVTMAGVAVSATSGTILLADSGLNALTPGLMYDDGRAEAEVARVQEAGADLWTAQSYRMQPSWALPKLLWLLRHSSPPRDAIALHQNDYIHTRLAGRLLATDSSNALKTGVDLNEIAWPAQILQSLGMDPEMLPEVVLPGRRIGEVCRAAAESTGIHAGTPIFAGMTDGCAAQIASGATAVGSWNSVVGTTLVMKGVTRTLLHDPAGVVYSHRSADGTWLPGGASSTGAGYLAKHFAADDIDVLNAEAMTLSPALNTTYPLAGRGERYPFFAAEAGEFTLGSPATPAEKFTAALQGIAFIERLAIDALRKIGADTGGRFTISGGAAKSEALNQLRANVLERTLHVPGSTEGAFGMAVLAASDGSSVADTAARMVRMERTIEPRRGFRDYRKAYLSFIDTLSNRGWLPPELATFTMERAQ